MASSHLNVFHLIVPKEAERAEVTVGSDVTIPCQLSPEISAVDMEIIWFKETDCVCLYKNKQMREGSSYKGRTGLSSEGLERGNVSLNLREFRKSDVGVYMCQVISGDGTEEITVRVNKGAKTDCDVQSVSHRSKFQGRQIHLTFQEANRTWEEKYRMKMEESALMTELDANDVKEFHQRLFKAFNDRGKKLEQTTFQLNVSNMNLERVWQQIETIRKKSGLLQNEKCIDMKEIQMEQIDKQLLQIAKYIEEKQIQLEKKDAQLMNISKLMIEKEQQLERTNKEMETSKQQLETLRQEQSRLKEIEKKEELRKTGDIKMCSFVTGEIKYSHMQFTGILRSWILNLREVSIPDKSDVVVVFCPIASQPKTDIAEALKKYNYPKPTVLVVLHHMLDPKKAVQDSSRWVNRKDTLTVDCLYNENEGLLNIPRVIDAADKIMKWLKLQGKNVTTHPFQHTGQMQHQLRSPSSSTLGGESNMKQQKMDHFDIDMTKKEMVKVYSILAGNTNKAHEEFIYNLINPFENLRVSTTAEQSDIIIVHCPIVSRAGTDIDAALKNFTENTDSQLGVLVVYHHTFDQEKTVPDSSRRVSMENILTVDCLFYEDTGLLKCQRNSDAMDKVVNWLIQQARAMGVKLSPRHKGAKLCSVLSAKMNNIEKEFIANLKSRIEDLSEVATVEESDIVVISCPIVSRAVTDIDAALKKITYSTGFKLTVLVVYHHTFDPEKTVRDSSRCVNMENILIVDCLFYEDIGLLKCQRNTDATDKAVNWLIRQGTEIDVKISPRQATDLKSTLPKIFSTRGQGKKQETSGDNKQPMSSTSSRPLNYFVSVTGDAKKHHRLFINALKKNLDVNLKEVSSLKESEVILMFGPDISEYDKRTGKPVVLISLNHTVDPNVQIYRPFEMRRDICPVDCIFRKGEGLLSCQINRDELAAVSNFIKKHCDH